ncbi:MAG TPA: hypothetical protein PKX48_06600 [Planctomycetota bacterium]|jgi:hypothetical protein|nr:hypothetical protein [Planctomycetota bacterium]OQC21296.1 MAG: hypothetical protein BWX69_01027 [Planctomycetes bacterium ADurb.Bin069]NMD34610.1 hypothetical protein [Planctomycetota bacterium]HNR99172.1 hypothetical protein [Planctomycetota bacterium]HNU25245.1 hypothetical protein [Planctomycetota bacterium]
MMKKQLTMCGVVLAAAFAARAEWNGAGVPGLTANRGDLILNGPVLGTGKFFHVSTQPKLLTLTNPGSTVSGYFGIYDMASKDSTFRFTSTADAGQPSALGASGDIHLAGTMSTTVFDYIGDADPASDKRFLLEGGWMVGDMFARHSLPRVIMTGPPTGIVVS